MPPFDPNWTIMMHPTHRQHNGTEHSPWWNALLPVLLLATVIYCFVLCK